MEATSNDIDINQDPFGDDIDTNQDPVDAAIEKAKRQREKRSAEERAAEGDAREKARAAKMEERAAKAAEKEAREADKPLSTAETLDILMKDLQFSEEDIDNIISENADEAGKDVNALIVRAEQAGGISRNIAVVRSTAAMMKVGIIDKVADMDETQLLAAYAAMDDVSIAGYITQCSVAHELYSKVRKRVLGIHVGKRAPANTDHVVDAALKKALEDAKLSFGISLLKQQALVHRTFFAETAQPSEGSGIDKVALIRLALEKLSPSLIRLAALSKTDDKDGRWKNLEKLVDLRIENPKATVTQANAVLNTNKPKPTANADNRFSRYSPMTAGMMLAISNADAYIKANKGSYACVSLDPDTLVWEWHGGTTPTGRQYLYFEVNDTGEVVSNIR